LRSLGPAAGSALPDLLDLIVKQPDTARPLADTVRALAPYWPLPAVAVARTLDRLRRSVVFSPDAFAVLAEIYAEFARDAWPPLVALLTGSDEQMALLAVPYFRDLTPVTGTVTAELTELFREPNPVYAARAVVALWRLGRVPVVADELLRAVATAQADCAWGW